MNVARILVAVARVGACCAVPGRPPDPAPRREAPLASGLVTVHRGDTIELRGARVEVREVTYLDQPCPPNVKCVHSGVIRRVLFGVIHTGSPVIASVAEGEQKVVDGVELAVKAVREGPEADVAASLPVAPKR